MEIQALTLTWVASVTFTVTPMQNTHYCIMQRANMQLRNICSGPMKMTHFVWCRRSLWNDIAHSASPVSTFSSVHLAAKKGAHYHAENGSPPPPPFSSCQPKWGAVITEAAYVCVCIRACMASCVRGEWEARGSAPLGNVHLQFFSLDTVGLLLGRMHRGGVCESYGSCPLPPPSQRTTSSPHCSLTQLGINSQQLKEGCI